MEKVYELPITNYESVCRTCLLTKGTTPLSDADNEENISLRELFQLCTNIKVEEEDKLPQTLCNTCTEDLLRTYKFIEMCKDSNIILNSTEIGVSTIVLKEEPASVLKCETNTQRNDNPSILNSFEIKVSSTEILEKEIKLANIPKCETDAEYKPDSNTQQASDNVQLHKKPKALDTKSDRTCSICGMKFSVPSKLNRHMRSHRKEKPHECNECLTRFSNYHNLIRHKLIHTGEKPHVCEICQKGFNQRSTLIVHKRIHTGEKPFTCDTCGKGFRSKTHCKKHLRTHYNNKVDTTCLEQFMCKVCGCCLPSKTALNVHLLQLGHGEKSFLCSYCGKGFATKANLQTHHVTHLNSCF